MSSTVPAKKYITFFFLSRTAITTGSSVYINLNLFSWHHVKFPKETSKGKYDVRLLNLSSLTIIQQ